MLRLKMPAKWSSAKALSFKKGYDYPLLWRATKPNPPPPPPPTQCYPLYSFYSPPHSTIRQRINCRSASFFGSCFATAVPHLSGVTTHDTVLQAIGAVFFRAARDVSGVRSSPPWARVVIKLKMSFQALSHSSSHARASALTSPPPDFLFFSIHQNPDIPLNPFHPILTKSSGRYQQ